MNRLSGRVFAEDYVIRTAKLDEDDDMWTIETESSTGFGVSRSRVQEDIWDEFKPKAGDEITLYMRNGSWTVGLDWKGERVFLYTEEEWEAERKFHVARHERQNAERLERERPKLDADYEALPQEFKDRVDRFRSNNPDFRRDYEAYEMFVCTEAVRIAKAFDGKDSFWERGGKAEKMLNGQGHSGNSADASVGLARLYIETPERVAKVMGALAPLVGSEEYGDVPREAT